MMSFRFDTARRYFLVFLILFITGCSGGGTCVPGGSPTPTPTPTPTTTPSPIPTTSPSPPDPGSLSLAIEAPNTYPAGLSTSIIVPITMVNTSNVDATNLVYTVPNADNYTGVIITPNATGVAGNNCTSIPAGTSCNMTVTVAAFANPGSFTLVATPSVSNAGITPASNDSIRVTANIELVDVPDNGELYAILPTNQTIVESAGYTTVYFSVWVKNDSGLSSFTFTNDSGEQLDSVSVVGTEAFTANSVNSYKITIPNGVNIQKIKVTSNTCSSLSDNCSNTGSIHVVPANSGVLSISPNYFNMSESYHTQVVMLSNTGTGNVSDITYPVFSSPFSVTNNTCENTTTLIPNQSCSFSVVYTADFTGGESTFHISYKNGQSEVTQVASTKIVYAAKVPDTIVNITTLLNPTDQVMMGNFFRFRASVTGGSTTVRASFVSPVVGVITSDPENCNLNNVTNESCIFTVYTVWNSSLNNSLHIESFINISVTNGAMVHKERFTSVFLTPNVYLPRTGQTSASPFNVVGITGADGNVQSGVASTSPRFIDNGCDITDSLTGLTWLKNLGVINKTSNFESAVNMMNAGTWCDQEPGTWRIPNVNELLSLVNYSYANQANWLMYGSGNANNPQCSGACFESIGDQNYVTSTTIPNKPLRVYGVAFQTYAVVDPRKLNAVNVSFAVRGISSANTPAKLPKTGQTALVPSNCTNPTPSSTTCSQSLAGADGVLKNGESWSHPRFIQESTCIVDHVTGLMWVNKANIISGGQSMAWADALNGANSLDLCGYTDWRLPNINELKSLINYGLYSQTGWLMYGTESASNVNCDGACFESVATGIYWSSTTAVSNNDNAYGIAFNTFIDTDPTAGGLATRTKTSLQNVFFVRGGIAPQ